MSGLSIKLPEKKLKLKRIRADWTSSDEGLSVGQSCGKEFFSSFESALSSDHNRDTMLPHTDGWIKRKGRNDIRWREFD